MSEKNEIKKVKFEGTIESLKEFECPEWFRDAKFGIWSHWGPQSVPMFGDWYAKKMYMEDSDQYRYHCRVYGHPSKFGYKDVIKLWKAENFNPRELMDLFVEAGAKYFVAQAMHHDNFDNYDSSYNPWNSTKVGPMKDICAMWKKEAKRYGLPFGLSEHLGASYTWFAPSHGMDKRGPYAGIPYDGADPENISLYRDNDSEVLNPEDDFIAWYTTNEKYHRDWALRIKDVIDKFQPELLYSDGELPFGDYGLGIVAHLYNTSAELNGGINNAVYNFKQDLVTNRSEGITRIGVLDIERGISNDISLDPWQDDTSLGDWFYNVKDKYKTAEDVVDTLVDVVAKNGNLLMNVTQRPDGTIDDETRYALKKIGAWIKLNGDGIYGTRPYKKLGEGKAILAAGAFQEGKAQWTSKDYRFTAKGNSIYAFQMRAEDRRKVVIKSLGLLYEKEIKEVTVAGQNLEFVQKDGALYTELPVNCQKDMPVCIKVTI